MRLEWSPDRPDVGYLMRSGDGGETWETIPTAPSDIIGELASKSAGWVWSSRTLHQTSDAGVSWSRIDAPGILPRGVGHPRPAIDHEGALWIATGHGSGWKHDGNVIARVLPGPRIETVLGDADFRVWALGVSDQGDLWLVVDDGEPENVGLMRLPSGQDASALSRVANLPSGSDLPASVRYRDRCSALGNRKRQSSEVPDGQPGRGCFMEA